ncbi:DUF6303 family protein [Streptomyces caniscabiei]|uniref:DUF6303 family protein n=1 Tax=Streptomyces caniscabiei TaxID=2746961 RepID=UPI0029BC62A4|nr:DUF6303 family protein [Streptomyces caniscabiei]MDX2601615.1 DUF6303 family protein [Streptomyces caniscabiei]MDX2741807.1 DUF6303 family protein [Streptomyces caniscabiei]MDX2781541.1 DUF6303 family protein [Streptomyces caniscabiei]
MADTFTAQMSVCRGRWRLYVVLLNTTERWPEYEFGPTVPTFTDRVNALTVLGFEPLPDAAWEWTEDTETPDDPSSPVLLIAATRVRSWTGAGA